MSHGEHCGDWIFFVVLFSASGMFPRRQLFAIATHRGGDEVSEDVGVAILSHLAGSEVRAMEQRDIPILQAADAALAYETVLGAITGERDAQQLALQERNDALISRRQLALRQGSAARATSLRELAANFVESSPIRRMRLSQASNVEERARMEIADLEERRRVQVGLTILAGGLATIRPA